MHHFAPSVLNRRAVIGAAAGLFALAGTSYAADNQALIAKAREEADNGKFIVMVSSPKGEKEQRAVMEAFQKRFNIKVDWEWLPLTSPVSGPRIAEQAKSNVRMPSAIGGYGYTPFEQWIVKNDLAMKVDWVAEFGSMFPSIKTAAVDSVLPRYRNMLIRQWDVQYVMVYNTRLVKKADLPASLDGLADPKWKGRFGMSNVNSSPLELLALGTSVDASVGLAKKLIANQPRFKAGPPAVVGAVASGETALAVCGYTALAESLKAKGAPIDWVPLDPLPVQPLFDFMLKGSPQPTLGKLFLAWLVTEGAAVQEKEEYLSSWANEQSTTTRAIKAAKPGIKIVEVKDDKDMELNLQAEKALMEVIAGAGK
jgi:iron(III) transport system substrate-binding protein